MESTIDFLQQLVIIKGHFQFTHGLHSDTYVSKELLISKPMETEYVVHRMADLVRDLSFGVVVGPQTGGAILGQRVAHILSVTRDIRYAWADKKEDGFEFREVFEEIIRGQDVLVVEDTTTTGGSIKKLLAAIAAIGGKVKAVVLLVNRGAITAESLGIPQLFALANVYLDAWNPAECPLCKQGISITTLVGHGKNVS